MKKYKKKEKYTPKGIVFIPTYNCTAGCRHCNNDFSKHNMSMKMDACRAVEILREGRDYGLNSLQITGGEITMYPEFLVSVINEARKTAIRVN
ncbi:MAG TPA: radical SAM protein, partial [Firmicutes bacterium]|nr:radical SAM protein [Bacillota bacterium]